MISGLVFISILCESFMAPLADCSGPAKRQPGCPEASSGRQ